MASGATGAGLDGVLVQAFARRQQAGATLIGQAGAVAIACRAIADRLRAGGTLLAFGTGSAAADAQHIAVEFLHPVIVGKPALRAHALTNDAATLTGMAGGGDMFGPQLRCLGTPRDVALGLSADGRCAAVTRGLRAARQVGMLTVALTGGDQAGEVAAVADHRIAIGGDDVLVVREVFVTAYHVLWELVHVFLEQPPEPAPVGAS